jgi:hypothetical protein
MGIDIDDIHQIAMLVQGAALQLHLDLVMMRVPIVLCSPIATDEKMLGDKLPLHSDAVHRTMLLSSMAHDAPLLSISEQHLNGLLRMLIEQGIGLPCLLQRETVSDERRGPDVL